MSRPDRKPQTQGALWLYGWHPVMAALANPARRKLELRITENAKRKLEEQRTQLPSGLPVILEKPDQLARLLPKEAVHQGICLKAEPLEDTGLEDILIACRNKPSVLLLVLDQVTDPHNVGAMLRSAAAFGVTAVITTARFAPHETQTLAKSASGALDMVPLVKEPNLARALEQLKEHGFWCYGLAGEGKENLQNVSFAPKAALVMGAEGEGLRRLTREHCDVLVRIPIASEIASLNVSNAAAVTLYAASTQLAEGVKSS